jgi:hypothetical protein
LNEPAFKKHESIAAALSTPSVGALTRRPLKDGNIERGWTGLEKAKSTPKEASIHPSIHPSIKQNQSHENTDVARTPMREFHR